MRFRDRFNAGSLLAEKLARYRDRPDVLVLGLPRGGVPVAFKVAEQLDAPLDLFLVRKLGVPGHEELAMGAVASGGALVINDEVVKRLAIPPLAIDIVARKEQRELDRRQAAYRNGWPERPIEGRTAILVDDGLATGSSMKAAVQALRQRGPKWVVVAVPVGAADACAGLNHEADEVICMFVPEAFDSVGAWYKDFRPPTDSDVLSLLDKAWRQRRASLV